MSHGFTSNSDDASARYLRILLPLSSLFLFVPILQTIYMPAANGLDIVLGSRRLGRGLLLRG